MVGADGALPLPWLAPVLEQTLRTQHAHALLLHGPQGVGQFELAVTLAQAWLCESAATGRERRPCGVCASCRLVLAHSHPDLLVLLPEALQESLGWGTPAGEGADAATEKGSKAKPSREIKVEAVRSAVAFAQTTSARGRVKVLVLHPAERLNGVSANTLLKTLEEPPGDARFVLSCAAPDSLLPTIRSRCQAVSLVLPPAALATRWLTERGVIEPEVLLAAVGGQPQEALSWFEQGVDAALWRRLPALVARGDTLPLAAWPVPRLIDALQKLSHDAACLSVGAAPRYFPEGSIRAGADADALAEWQRELVRCAHHAEHTWNAGLLLESLLQQGSKALRGAASGTVAKRDDSVHSRAW